MKRNENLPLKRTGMKYRGEIKNCVILIPSKNSIVKGPLILNTDLLKKKWDDLDHVCGIEKK